MFTVYRPQIKSKSQSINLRLGETLLETNFPKISEAWNREIRLFLTRTSLIFLVKKTGDALL